MNNDFTNTLKTPSVTGRIDRVLKSIRWLMLVSGVLTATMLYGLFDPQTILNSMFGARALESLGGTGLSELIVRSWSALIGLMGVVLIYGALNVRVRAFALSIAGASKLVFILLMVSMGREFLGNAGAALVMDGIVVVACGIYLVLKARLGRVYFQTD